MIVYVDNDQFLPQPQTAIRLTDLANTVSEQVFTVHFPSNEPNPHRTPFYIDEQATAAVLKAIP